MIALHIILIFLQLFCTFNLIGCYIVDPGPTVIATKGEVWPKPQEQTSSNDFYILRPQAFEFRTIAESCALLQNALERYISIINTTLPQSRLKKKGYLQGQYYKPWRLNKNFVGYLDSLDVLLANPCEDNQLPNENMYENYILNITSSGGQNLLSANTIWGILRGLETFSQLLFATEEEALQINCTTIYDYPRFSYRGLLVDTSRHFIPVPKILKTLDAMAYNKLNVFHWHITDDQSFPYQSLKYPELSEKGAYLDTHVYSSSDVQKIISYAGARGIRVLVEFDTPGHTRSWGEAFPELLTPCYKNGVPTGQYGPMDPTKNFTYDFLTNFFDEVIRVFPEQYLHLGGDEVEFECWQSNPDIENFMTKNNISSYTKLEDYYIQKLLNIVDNLKAKSIIWEEVFINGVQLPKSTLVHVWRNEWQTTLFMVTRAGFPALLSACWYLDHLSTGGDWVKYYNCDPYDFTGTPAQKKLILGGEACMWAEVVNEFNIESRVWPRASAPAEKLWSARDADTVEHASRRLEEHTCRMNKRGIGAQPPNSAGFCEL